MMVASATATSTGRNATASAKPTLQWLFSGVLQQTGTCTGPASAQRPSCADVTPANTSTELAANPTLNGGTIVAKPVGDFNDKDFISFDDLDDYQVTPFFDEMVCYHLGYQAAGGGPLLAKFKPALYGYFGVNLIMVGQRLAFEVFYDQAEFLRSDTVEGKDCSVFRYDCSKHQGDDPDCNYYDFYVTSEGHLLQLNSANSMGTADPNVDLHITTSILVANFTASPPASSFEVPVTKSGCLDLKPASYSSLDPVQAYAHSMVRHVNDPKRIEAINQETAGSWVAGPNANFENWTLANTTVLTQADWHFGVLQLPEGYDAMANEQYDIPASFDARTQWSDCDSVSHIRNQGQCGSCWAFAAMESLADRFCIADSSKYADLTLSAQHVMGCDGTSHGCNGGYIDEVWTYLRDQGTTTETCDPYQHCKEPSSISCGPPSPPPAPGARDTCDTKCSDGSALGTMYRAKSAYAAAKPGDVAGIQAEIIKNGPLEVGYYVFSDFQNYQSGVYKRTASAQPTGKHAVKLVGWGTEGSQDYWIVANSWSPAWGEKGFFRIARGTNECGIEMVPAAGEPLLS